MPVLIIVIVNFAAFAQDRGSPAILVGAMKPAPKVVRTSQLTCTDVIVLADLHRSPAAGAGRTFSTDYNEAHVAPFFSRMMTACLPTMRTDTPGVIADASVGYRGLEIAGGTFMSGV
jgi:hypothetical protein